MSDTGTFAADPDYGSAKLVAGKKKRGRKNKRRRYRELVKDYALNYMEDNPDATPAEIEAGVRAELQGDFGANSESFSLLLALFIKLLPILLELFAKD